MMDMNKDMNNTHDIHNNNSKNKKMTQHNTTIIKRKRI